MCPECNQPLIAFELDGIEIDRCIRCGGTWLDVGELEMIAELERIRTGALSQALKSAKGDRHDKRRCPRCRRKLERIRVGKENEIELDRCRVGHGLWFDKGEMEAVVADYAEGQEGAVARFFKELYRYEIQTGKRGE